MRSMKHQFNYGRSATGESEAVSPTRHAITRSTLREKSLIRWPGKSPNQALKSCCPPLNRRKVSAKVIEFKSDFHAMRVCPGQCEIPCSDLNHARTKLPLPLVG